MANPLEKEFQYYLEHQDELVAKYKGRVIVIKDGAVVGDYDNEIIAVQETQKVYPLGTFLIQRCEPGRANYTRTFHSRVAFA
ncbi:MAG: hypothetical protein ABSC38_03395 [Verrucomicrobiia bacterium]